MARIIKHDDPNRPDTAREREDVKAARLHEQDVIAGKRIRDRYRASRAGYRHLNIDGQSMPGDRTYNTPSLRKDAKFQNKLDLSTHTYLMIPNGICACVDENGEPDHEFTAQVLQHYRWIMAAGFHERRKVL